MFKRFIMTILGLAVLTASASAQYYPQTPYQQNPYQYQQNRGQPANSYWCTQHRAYCNHKPYNYQTAGPAYQTEKDMPSQAGQPGQTTQLQNNFYYCETHGQYCNHAPLVNQNYNNNQGGYYYDGRYYPNNNGRYQTNRNNGHRAWGSDQGNNPPPGHYWCNTHKMYCSH